MGKPKVYVTRLIPDQGLDLIRQFCDMTLWQDDLPPPRDVLLRETHDADGLVSLLTDSIDPELMDACPKLRVVSNMAVGFDNINVSAATERGILAGNTPGVLTETTADFAFALLMAAARRIPEGVAYVKAGKWQTWGPMLLMGPDVHHSTLGLVGLGRIGAEMAKRARGFDMRVLYYDVFRREDLEQSLGLTYAPLDDVLAQADFISIHTPLTPETHHLMNRDRFSKMKSSAILINTSRGPVVESDALLEALRSGQIAGAALDVTEPEPLPADHPLVSLPNCIIVPHIASASAATRGQMAEIAARNLIAGLKGEPLPSGLNPDALGHGRSALPKDW
ncbi:MAG: D-3-phosphoglycerate dehydrogenase [Ktedonobacterales bacterium]|jgi:glyoxylate reductase|nr:MAG: D-3-phosphoglycerate dehydrogenase [Ktedonobacterales bacterium]